MFSKNTPHTSRRHRECRSEMCCTRLAGNARRKKSPKIHHLRIIAQLCRAISSQVRHISTIGKFLNNNTSSACPYNMVNFGPLTAEICWGFGAQKTISSYNFDRIILIFGYIVERTNTKILSSHFFAISILNPNYDVINDVISGFANVVVERCGFHHWIAQRISWGEVVSLFLYLL